MLKYVWCSSLIATRGKNRFVGHSQCNFTNSTDVFGNKSAVSRRFLWEFSENNTELHQSLPLSA